jgi:hypothetical protein
MLRSAQGISLLMVDIRLKAVDDCLVLKLQVLKAIVLQHCLDGRDDPFFVARFYHHYPIAIQRWYEITDNTKLLTVLTGTVARVDFIR